jgi:TRAP-type uncharacterized transport system fused permease subunit
MDTSRISQGELIAGIGGLGLFLFLFLNWFAGFSGWETFDIVDVLLAVIGLGVAAVVAARAAGTAVNVPGGPLAIALAGFAAVCITLTFLLEGDEREIGVFLEFIAALAVMYGGWQAARGPGATTRPPVHTDTTTP